jgi:two-component system, NtrC family, sensor histidine kinase HydH
MRFREEGVGIVLVGEKLSGAYYTDQDLELMATLMHQCSLAFTNARAYEVLAETQAELVQSERMAAVGELASAVAHGIRNPLAGIRSSAQVAREDLPDDTDVNETLDDIIGEVDRLEQRVRTILEFARPVELQLVPGDLNQCLRRFAAELRTRLPDGVRLDLELRETVPPVRFDAIRLTEVLDTVAVNALEAMDGAGTLEIRSDLAPQDGSCRRALIAISDDGPGIDEHMLRRVFDLFVTSKPSGTGVGLAMAKRLIERQGGSLEVTSRLGEGATFRIYLLIPDDVRADSA